MKEPNAKLLRYLTEEIVEVVTEVQVQEPTPRQHQPGSQHQHRKCLEETLCTPLHFSTGWCSEADPLISDLVQYGNDRRNPLVLGLLNPKQIKLSNSCVSSMGLLNWKQTQLGLLKKNTIKLGLLQDSMLLS